MKKRFKMIGVVTVLLFVLAACSTKDPGTGDSEDAEKGSGNGTIKIGLSISTLNNPFFVTLRDGAEKAANEKGFELVTSDAQDDPSTQLSDIEDLLQQDIDALLVNPVDSEAIVSAVELANNADIPVITVDRSSEGGEVAAHIASDNVEGGKMVGEFIAEQLGEEGKVVELEGIPGASATRERGQGFHEIVDDMDGIEIVANQTANFDRTEGLSVMENIIQSTDQIDAVFAHNDEMALGALEALEAKGVSDVIVVGFDATDDAVEAVEGGRMDATIAQKPELIGESAIETAEKVVKGEKVEEFIPVELELITK
ncbi:D-ribose ABC transporter substrate-binding protein [Lentibacillus populi]|uniref:D-ribose ABC transporter substrate-binding protein n=1 Tax=Lentibacillus populi TaxID=1827502 RepID=A0A9W5TYM0_9BACI|nr:ribose ABC transporter substrate-binding protein RbsB [Lentibacillus populi]MBT2217558.1 ribose ABC transporter substrate-binding protein RbsB [Virgibacillus dakarensis]GGB45656.1 D-ribose ABC transporter substrate-binding protein [Lentibacillus populi]